MAQTHPAAALIQNAAATHSVDAGKLSASLTAHGWDFSPLDLGNAEMANFVTKVINSRATDIAARAANKAAIAAAADAARIGRMTSAARANPTRICGKCDGAGKVWATWVANGVCFQCSGAGILRASA
jgi:hypothetical protein